MKALAAIVAIAVLGVAIWWMTGSDEDSGGRPVETRNTGEGTTAKVSETNAGRQERRMVSEPYEEVGDKWQVRALDGETKNPVADAEVFLISSAEAAVREQDRIGQCGPNGVADVKRAGRFLVTATGYCHAWCVVDSLGTQDVFLKRSASLRGTVTDCTGSPVANIMVSFSVGPRRQRSVAADASVITAVAGDAGVAGASTTNAHGEFVVEGLPEGSSVFCHIDSIDYRISEFGATVPLVARSNHPPLEIKVFPVYMFALWYDGWPRGNRLLAQRRFTLPKGLRRPVDIRANGMTYDAIRDQVAVVRKLARRAVRATGREPNSTRAWIHGLFYGDGLTEEPPRIVARDWKVSFWIGVRKSRGGGDRHEVHVPAVTLARPSEFGAEDVTIVDMSSEMAGIYPGTKRVYLRFVGKDGPLKIIPPFVLRDPLSKRAIVKKKALEVDDGLVDLMLPASEIVVEPWLDAEEWPTELRETFEEKKINVIEKGDVFDVPVTESATVVRLKVRDRRTGRFEEEFSYKAPVGRWRVVLGEQEAVFGWYYTDQLELKVSRMVGWGEDQLVTKSVELRPGEVNEVVVEM